MGSFFKRGAVRIVLEYDDDMTDGVGIDMAAFIYRQRETIPIEWSSIIGDIIHNLRSSLDLMVCDVFRLTKGNPQDIGYVQYPFSRDKDRLHQQIRDRRLGRIGKEFTEVIEATAPYKDGNRGLRAIHDLDVLDKHQMLVPTVSIVEIDWPVPVKDSEKFVTKVANDGQRIVMFPKGFTNLPYGTQIKADFSIIFAEGTAFEGSYVIKQLRSCLSSIDAILGLFKRVAVEKNLVNYPSDVLNESDNVAPNRLNYGLATQKDHD
ncbi:hypothetical protein MBRA_02484 [Methylobacterium brachiatum]|nr:hypothetical protein MBRA_02484 [Methylobacterium brachiatum]